MIIQRLKRTVVAERNAAYFCHIVCSIAGGLVMVLGIWRLAELDLTQAQLYTAMTGTLFLAGVFIVLGFQCRAWRRTAQQSACT
jgi:uncharacterized membrane protein SirB2